MTRRSITLLVALVALFCGGMFTEAPVTGQGQAVRPEDNRPPVFFREEWTHQFDRGGPPEGPVGQEHVSHQALELKHYGEPPKGDPGGGQPHTHAGMWMNKRFANDPAHLFTGTCNRPCALTLRHRTQFVDLSGFGAKIRWFVKISGFHQVRPVLKLADGTYLVGHHVDVWVDAFDWYVSDILIGSVRWRRLDPDKVVTMLGAPANAVGWVEKPDLSRVDEVGFVDLIPGSGHGNGGFADIAWIEVHGRPVPRGGSK